MTKDNLKAIQTHTILAAFTTALSSTDGETLSALQEDLRALNQMKETPETITARNLVTSAIMFHVTGDAEHLQAAAETRDKIGDLLIAGGAK
ncbi:hypothetical protein ABE61_22640 [Lysinibacillus sphaericus]|uniref:hypothetical protein n=1 Tax=Lysinibacillus sphaericus TaxID=1421 RepID=UPI0018CE64E6|nr:hypothetical protein [Lysinibacillus sphaericus]MBG9456731.1 hypothetical protein [Lysinibacillus sphaericus]MBG9476895.1 hypothetical protein [Lysinibacillus sphaericus]MBG9591444.1 hypothetical protein [Lysinibacillus sphaericus]